MLNTYGSLENALQNLGYRHNNKINGDYIIESGKIKRALDNQ